MFMVEGEHQIEGEGTYEAGDVRWVKGGQSQGAATSGPDGVTWWLITYGDPIPVDEEDEAAKKDIELISAPQGELPRVARPYNWEQIDETILQLGGVVLKGFFDDEQIAGANEDIDNYLSNPSGDRGDPHSGSRTWDEFLGHKTIRLHGLPEKAPRAGAFIGNDELVDAIERLIGPMAAAVWLNAGELIQIMPGEPSQFLHRDTDTWKHVKADRHPILVNAIVRTG